MDSIVLFFKIVMVCVASGFLGWKIGFSRGYRKGINDSNRSSALDNRKK